MRLALRPALICLPLLLAGCGYGNIQNASQEVETAWGEVLAQYQFREKLVEPTLIALGPYIDTRSGLVKRVQDARDQTRGLGPVAPPSNAASLQRFQQRQAELSVALDDLLAAAETGTNIGDAAAQIAQVQKRLDDSQNRITGAQARYIRAIAAYNNRISRFPDRLTASYLGKEQLPTFVYRYQLNEAIVLPPHLDPSQPEAAPATADTQPAPAIAGTGEG